jgi:hypothetical protein
MNFNVYVDKETGERLARLARRRRTSRNALIREALARLLEREQDGGWPPEVIAFEGVRGAVPFERARRRLGAPARDPLA